jgi:hypothetical protein
MLCNIRLWCDGALRLFDPVAAALAGEAYLDEEDVLQAIIHW